LCVFGLCTSCYDVHVLDFALVYVLFLHCSPLDCLNYSPTQTDMFSLFTCQYLILGSVWVATLRMHLLWWKRCEDIPNQEFFDLDSI
jgi:hypothetical protein